MKKNERRADLCATISALAACMFAILNVYGFLACKQWAVSVGMMFMVLALFFYAAMEVIDASASKRNHN